MSAEASKATPRLLLDAMYRGVDTGVAVVDADGVQTYANPAFCEMLGYTPEELVGRSPPFPYWPADELDAIQRAFEATMQRRAPAEGFELRFAHKDGRHIDVRLRITPVGEAGEAPVGWLAAVRDISARRRTEWELAEAQAVAQIGSWEWIVATGEVRWSKGLYRLFGLDPETFEPSFEGWASRIVDEERGDVIAALQRTLEGGEPYNPVIRINHADGEVRIQQVRARLERGANGQPIRLYGTTQDITEQKRVEEARLEETIHRIAVTFAQEVDEPRLQQQVIDEATALAEAACGALFVRIDEAGEPSMKPVASAGVLAHTMKNTGADGAFDLFRAAAAEPEGALLIADLSADRHFVGRRFGAAEPALSSGLVVAITTGRGALRGGLLFGHPSAGFFGVRHVRLSASLARHAAVALDNARLYSVLRRSEEEAHAARVEALRVAAVLAEQRNALEMIATGDSLSDTLDRLVRLIERFGGDDISGSVLLYEGETETLHHGAAPSLPAAYNDAIDGVKVGPSVGSCGTAAYDDREVLVTDIEHDPLWADFADLALEHGLRACWSTPIHASRGHLLGTFAIYFATPRGPTPEERELLETLNRTAAVAIERRRVEQALEAARRRKDEFLALLGHELRNPLAPILTALELMEMRTGDHARERIAIERHVRHMVQLVDDLLDISRVTRGKLTLDRRPTDLRAVLRGAAEMASPLVEEREHHLEVRMTADLPAVDGDAVRLGQVFANLLTNAARYTEPGGHIEVTARRVGSSALVEVVDDGEGIEPALIPELFEPFIQGARRVDRARGGLGLGLPLVRNLVELHGGAVEVRSDGPGTGTSVAVRLPLAAAPAVDAEASPVPAVSEARRKILVIDDNEDAADLLAELLRLGGYEVATAGDGPAALALSAVTPFDVAIVDIGLPIMDGFEVGRRLAAERPLRLIALTGYGEKGDRERSAAAGFHAHLVKPVSREAVIAAIEDPAGRG